MKYKLAIVFLQNLKEGKASLSALKNQTSCTPGQLFDFVRSLISFDIVKITGDVIEVVDFGEKFSSFKKLNVSLVRAFNTQEIKSICDKLNESLFIVLNYIYHNDGCSIAAIQNNLAAINNLDYSIVLLTKMHVVAELCGEYYCSLGANDFKTVCTQMSLKGITLDPSKDKHIIIVDFCFNGLTLSERVDCLKTPTAILCDLYYQASNNEIKRKLMIQNLNLFAKYRTAIDFNISEFAIIDEINSKKIPLDFESPLVDQISTALKKHEENGVKIKIWVEIKTKGVR